MNPHNKLFYINNTDYSIIIKLYIHTIYRKNIHSLDVATCVIAQYNIYIATCIDIAYWIPVYM